MHVSREFLNIIIAIIIIIIIVIIIIIIIYVIIKNNVDNNNNNNNNNGNNNNNNNDNNKHYHTIIREIIISITISYTFYGPQIETKEYRYTYLKIVVQLIEPSQCKLHLTTIKQMCLHNYELVKKVNMPDLFPPFNDHVALTRK